MRTISRASSDSSTWSCSARGASSWTPASTPSTGRASRPSTTASKPSEVERYVVNPGQACSYMMGELKILGAARQGEEGAGRQVLDQDFHSAVLSAGTVPLDLLERRVDALSSVPATVVASLPERRERRARVSRAASPDALCIRDNEDPRGDRCRRAIRPGITSTPSRSCTSRSAQSQQRTQVLGQEMNAGRGAPPPAGRGNARAGRRTRQRARARRPGDPRDEHDELLRRARDAPNHERRRAAVPVHGRHERVGRRREGRQHRSRFPGKAGARRIAGSARIARRSRPGRRPSRIGTRPSRSSCRSRRARRSPSDR